MNNNFLKDELKQISRLKNLEEVARLPVLIERQTGRLKYDWAELAGQGAPTMQTLIDKGMLPHPMSTLDAMGRFLGVENDQKTFQALCTQWGETSSHHQFYCETLECILQDSRFDRVGVINADTFYLATGKPFQRMLEMLWDFALHQRKRIGGFALIVNVGLDRSNVSEKTIQEALKTVGYHLSDEVLQSCVYKNRKSRRFNHCVLFGFPRENNHGKTA